MKNGTVIRLIIIFTSMISFSVAAERSVEIVSDHPVLGIPDKLPFKLVLHDLSEFERLKEELPVFNGNPNDREFIRKSKESFEQWFNSVEGKQWVEAVKKSQSGRLAIANYELEKIPAIIFDDGRFVIYGITDIGQAIHDYDNYVLYGGQHDQ